LTEYKKSAFFAYNNLPMTETSITTEICVILLNYNPIPLREILEVLPSITGNDATMVITKLLTITFGVE
jgi:hypothetical protein